MLHQSCVAAESKQLSGWFRSEQLPGRVLRVISRLPSYMNTALTEKVMASDMAESSKPMSRGIPLTEGVVSPTVCLDPN